jgi:hypothetical protein
MAGSSNRRRASDEAEEAALVLVGGEDHVWFEDRWMVASLCDE